MKGISVIIPTLNEEDIIGELLHHVIAAVESTEKPYEILVVDDRSRDGTEKIVKKFSKKKPVTFIEKNGPRGKASSLLTGFSHGQYDTLVMIDADMQYHPEVIPHMLEKLQGDGGIVIGERQTVNITAKRAFLMRWYRQLFGRYLHGMDADVMSGLKVMKKEVVDRLDLHPYPWTFDIELLVKARNAGYKIDSVPITFDARKTGVPKINLLTAAVQMMWHAIALWAIRPDTVPFSGAMTSKKGEGFHFGGSEYVHHSLLETHEHAFFRLSVWQILAIFVLLGIVLIGMSINWHATIVIIIALMTVLYFIDLLFNLFLIYRSFSKPPEIIITPEQLRESAGREWPVYSIFCPLYKEWHVVPQFIEAMQKLDYPADKLQILLLLEEDDAETIQKVREYQLPEHFSVVIVPDSNPKTKPKALNYALKIATGEYAVIYDAEDVPDPDQLKKTVLSFEQSDKKTICIQAKLNFYNPHQNVLTKVFTAEYSLWFDLVLTGLQSIHAPIPLGGTSNHFRIEALRRIRGWDAFNVTEDCDLGIRLVKRGYKTAIVDSTTLEEANSSLPNWFRQRSRWIKGYMQTYLVHMRKPGDFMRDWKDPHVITFQLIVGGKILSMFINPIMWIITILYFAMRATTGEFIESFFPTPILYMGVFSLLFGNFLYLYYYMIGCAKREHYELIKYAFLVPAYWLAMSIAAWMAVYELLFRPHYWQKTQHGLHLHHSAAVAT